MRNTTIKLFDVKIVYEDGKDFNDSVLVVNKTLATDHAKAHARKAGFLGKIKKVTVSVGEEEEVEEDQSETEECAKTVKEQKNVNASVTKKESALGGTPVVENVNAEEESKSSTENEEPWGQAV